jgi:hypothetical protein
MVMESSHVSYHVLIAVWTPDAGVCESFLLDGGLRSLATVRDRDGAFDTSVEHVHRGAYSDVIAAL